MTDREHRPAIHIGVLDTGIAATVVPETRQTAFQTTESGGVCPCPLNHDNLEHGTAVAGAILARAPDAELHGAQVFRQGRPAAASVVAAGMLWLLERGIDIVNMSFGLRHDREVLRAACEQALGRGVLLVASTPARGGPVYPAAYSGVIRVTGDARCAPGELSWLGGEHADFGACVGGPDHRPHQPGFGSSLAAAHCCGELARLLTAGVGRDEAVATLRRNCRYHGREHRGAS